MNSRQMMNVLSVSAMTATIGLAAGAAHAAPITIIDGDGNLAAPYSPKFPDTTGDIVTGQTIDGLGAAQITFDLRNEKIMLEASAPRPILEDNTLLTGEVYVTSLNVDDTAQGWDRLRITLHQSGESQVTLQAGISGVGMNWLPTQANTWQSFSFDLTQMDGWTADLSTREVYRIQIMEDDDPDHQNSFALRNVIFTAPIPEPASAGLLAAGLGLMLVRRRQASA